MRHRTRCLRVAFIALPFVSLLAAAPPAAAALQQVQDFGDNPSNIAMFVHVPANLASPPPVLVALHYCSGSAQAYYSGLGAGFATQANQYGFIVIYPETKAYGSCWDVFSPASLSHNGGSDSKGIVSMVNYVVTTYGADASRVYAAGSSSGAMMTNVLLGAYPDVFKAGAAFSGVPFGCWSGADASSGWNSACANGQVTKTPQEWGNLVRAAYPGYTGYRPRMQLWHGDADATISFTNFGEAIDEWTDVLGVSRTPTSTEENTPQQGFTRTRYADGSSMVRVEAIQEAGQPHSISVSAAEVIRFFGLDKNAPDPGVGTGGAGGSGAGTGGSTGGSGGASGEQDPAGSAGCSCGVERVSGSAALAGLLGVAAVLLCGCRRRRD